MANTIRCKNATINEFYNLRTGCGFYHDYDQLVRTGNGHGGYWTFRELTPRECYKRWSEVHGESEHANARTPDRHNRLLAEDEHRAHAKEELVKWMKDPDYDVQIRKKPKSCYRWY